MCAHGERARVQKVLTAAFSVCFQFQPQIRFSKVHLERPIKLFINNTILLDDKIAAFIENSTNVD